MEHTEYKYSLYNATSSTHNGYYTKQITPMFESA